MLCARAILPLLKHVPGFRRGRGFVLRDGHRAVWITLWDRRENAETYRTVVYPTILRTLRELLSGDPRLEVKEVRALG